MKTVTYIQIGFSEFEELVNEHLPSANGEYEFIIAQECDNDSLHQYRKVGSEYDSVIFQKYVLPGIESGDFDHNAGAILEVLCHKGIIEPGNYIIDVCRHML